MAPQRLFGAISADLSTTLCHCYCTALALSMELYVIKKLKIIVLC